MPPVRFFQIFWFAMCIWGVSFAALVTCSILWVHGIKFPPIHVVVCLYLLYGGYYVGRYGSPLE